MTLTGQISQASWRWVAVSRFTSGSGLLLIWIGRSTAVVMHVSNRHLELASVVVGIADANDLKSWVYSEDSNRDNEYIFATEVVVSAREEADVGKLASSDVWALTEADENQRVWTDDYSNVLGAVWRRLRYGEQ